MKITEVENRTPDLINQLLEIWEDKDSLKAHQQTPHFKAMPAIKDQFVEKTDCVRYDTL